MRTLSMLFWSFRPGKHAQTYHKMVLKVIQILRIIFRNEFGHRPIFKWDWTHRDYNWSSTT